MAKIVLYYLLPLALMVYTLVDCAQDDDVERTSVPKALWIVMIILLPYAGPIAWLVVAKIARPRQAGNRGGRSGGPGWFSGGSRNSRPMGPDDDPEFLRRLAEEQQRKKRQEGRGEPGDNPTPQK